MVKASKINCSILVITLGSLLFSLAARAATVEKIVATVDGEAVTTYDLDQAMKTLGPSVRQEHNVSGVSLRAKVLDELIGEKVLENEMKKSGITVEPHEVDSFIDRILRSSGITLDNFTRHLLDRGITLDEYKKQIHDQIQRSKFINNHVGRKVNISERELKDYFMKHMDEFHGASSVRLAQISILFTPQTTQDDFKEIERVAMDIGRAAMGTSNFESLAKRYSGKAYRVEGGDLGIVKIDDLQPPIAKMVAQLDVGRVSPPIPTNAGLHIVKILERAKTSEKDFSTVREQVYAVLYDIKVREALRGYVKQLKRKAHVEIKGLGLR